jgi:hypothetical protein
MALQKRFNDPRKHFVDPYWTIISGVLSHGRSRAKNDARSIRESAAAPKYAIGPDASEEWFIARRQELLKDGFTTIKPPAYGPPANIVATPPDLDK